MESGTLTDRTIGPYQILETLGEGGMGVVYKAKDSRLGRLVALKVIRGDRADSDTRRRFLREAQTASALNHPNILTIYDVGTDAGQDYIAMEFVAGGTLADRMSGGPLSAENALRLVRQVAEALEVAHASSIVHRDLKPTNIMLPAPDRVKVVDFGLARHTGSSGTTPDTLQMITADHAIVGTIPYMSPEQASGLPVDSRSDVFSLGIILYELLSGRRPFAGHSDIDTLVAIVKDTPPPIAGISGDVARILDRCLCKDAAQRFQSGAELKASIDECLSPQHVESRPSVAVLPFTSMSGAKDDDFFCDGLAEEIINELTKIQGLRVIARTSAFVIGRMGLDIREIGARLGVDSILQGSVRRDGNRVRVAAQLVAAKDGSQMWSDRYDREMTDVLRLEDEIANAIAARLRVQLAGGSRSQAQPVADAEAYAAYLEGRYYFAKGTPDAFGRALACYERAIARDPQFALAYDSLAELHWYLGFFGAVPPREAFSVSMWNAMRAIQLDDSMAQSYALLGMLRKELDYNWPEVDRELRHARELNRESPLVRLRYAISGPLPHGRLHEALAEVEEMLKSDPLSLFVRWWVAIIAYLLRDYDRVVAEGRHMIALDPSNFFGHWAVGCGLVETEAVDEAVSEIEKADELTGHMSFTLGFLGYGYAKAGRRDDCRLLLDRIIEASATKYISPSAFAFCYIGLEEWDNALLWLDRSIDARDPVIIPMKTFPLLDPIRSDPRFAALLRKMHLE